MYSNIKKGACRQLSNLDISSRNLIKGKYKAEKQMQIASRSMDLNWDFHMANMSAQGPYGTSWQYEREVQLPSFRVVPLLGRNIRLWVWRRMKGNLTTSNNSYDSVSSLNSWVESDREYMRRIRRLFLTHIISSICIILYRLSYWTTFN